MVEDVEFVKLTFEGQSFMLHQIRKMIGLIVLVQVHISSWIQDEIWKILSNTNNVLWWISVVQIENSRWISFQIFYVFSTWK